jgi:hypothetical protein
MRAYGYVVVEKIKYKVFALFHENNSEHPSSNIFRCQSCGFQKARYDLKNSFRKPPRNAGNVK